MIILEPITLTIIGAFISTGLGWVAWKIRKRNEKRRQEIDEIHDLKKAVWRLNKTVVILAKLLDKISKKAHPEIETELEEIARELLTTSNDYEETT